MGMESESETEQHFHHATLPCPLCEQPVHVVVAHPSHKARWVCLTCKTTGVGPFAEAPRPAVGS